MFLTSAPGHLSVECSEGNDIPCGEKLTGTPDNSVSSAASSVDKTLVIAMSPMLVYVFIKQLRSSPQTQITADYPRYADSDREPNVKSLPLEETLLGIRHVKFAVGLVSGSRSTWIGLEVGS